MTKSDGFRRIVLWLAAAVGVTAVASLVIAASVGASGRPLSERDVAQQLADETATTGATPPTSTPTVTVSGDTSTGSEILGFAPGSVVASCDGGLVTVHNWTPNPGYRADDVARGPAASASVWFESDTVDDVEVIVTCDSSGAVVATLNTEYDDHGGNRGPGGGGDSGDSGGRGRDHPEDD